jgi:hypothetical protein
MPYRVFISSTQNDIELARDLARRLEAAGIHVFSVDQTVVSGESIVTAVSRDLREADEVMVILTKDSSASPGLLSEMGMAFSLQKSITPVIVNLKADELPPMVKQLPHISYADLPKYIAELATRAQSPKPDKN